MNEIIAYKELKTRLQAIPNTEHRAFLCTVYACMARVSEVIDAKTSSKPGIWVQDIESFENKLVIRVRTSKTKGKIRTIPLFRNRETWLINIIEAWAQHCRGALFPRSFSWAFKVFKKHFPEIYSNRGNQYGAGRAQGGKHTIHWLRGWRYTHYRWGDITGKPLDSKPASLLGGWVTPNMPETLYNFSQISDFEAELENN